MKLVQTRHLKKAIDLIEGDHDVVVERRRHDSALRSQARSWWIGSQRVILGTDDPPWLVLAVLAHEFGHCLNVRVGSASSMRDYMLYRLGAPLTRAQKRRILKEERDAWRRGFRFLRQNGLPVTDRMQWARGRLLRTHVALF